MGYYFSPHKYSNTRIWLFEITEFHFWPQLSKSIDFNRELTSKIVHLSELLSNTINNSQIPQLSNVFQSCDLKFFCASRKACASCNARILRINLDCRVDLGIWDMCNVVFCETFLLKWSKSISLNKIVKIQKWKQEAQSVDRWKYNAVFWKCASFATSSYILNLGQISRNILSRR